MKNLETAALSRRRFILRSGALLGAAVWLGPALALGAEKTKMETAEVTPTEDLMQEHGVLRRLLLIYDAMGSRLSQGGEVPLEVLREATGVIRRFVEDYHEKDEEEYLFTRFEKAGKLVELVKVLYQQHQAGRKLTTALQGLLSQGRWGKAPERQQAAVYLHAFARMYRPHAAREDTVLYPAFRAVISPKEFLDLGEKFEAKEEKLFGKDGFEKVVAQVAHLEQRLGIYELSQFTPKA
jgi:hemerythrin-like domain-containing protein